MTRLLFHSKMVIMKVTKILPTPKPRRHIGRRIAAGLVFLLVIAATTWTVLNRQLIIDQITVWQYELPAEVLTLAKDSGLNDHGKFLLRASRAELNERAEFNRNCTMRESQAIVLGCFAARRIFIFNVTDERISGVRAVTAAHEMLHAAYARLGTRDRQNLDQLLEEQLARTTDQSLLELINIYAQSEPDQKFNELHSLFGTEVYQLSPALETYYKKYFADRHQVVQLYHAYSQVFTDLNTRAEKLQQELNAKNAAIAAASAQYRRDANQLSADIDEFNRCAKELNCFASQAAFDRARAALMTRQNDLQTTAAQINGQIDQYNAGVADLNALGIEAQKLNQSIDSHAPVIE